MPHNVTALILAGSRPGPDPLLDGTGVRTKALLPVARKPMIAHPLAALSSAPEIKRIVVCAGDLDGFTDVVEGVRDVELRTASATIAQTVENAVDDIGSELLVTTADHVLLTGAMIARFVSQAQGCDLAAAMVERRVLQRAGYDTRRTWLSFRGGKWSGANMFWLAGPQCQPLIRFWSQVEQDRKKGRRIIAAFGPVTAAAAALRLADIHTLVRRAGHRFGLDARIVSMPQAEACIDCDKPDDLALIERILARRTP